MKFAIQMISLFRTSSLLTISQGINVILSFAITLLLTQSLEIAEFGVYTFYLICVYLISMFIDFGLNEAGAQDLAEFESTEGVRIRVGNIYFLGVFVCILFSICVLIISIFVDHIFVVKAGKLLRETWWLLFSVPVYELTKSICRGCGFMWRWSVVNILPRLFFLISLLLIIDENNLNLQHVVQLFALSYFASTFVDLMLLRPRFLLDGIILTRLIKKIRSFGLNVMISVSVLNGTFFLDRLFISLVLNSNVLAYYQLAVMLSNPVGMFSRSLGISTFRNYINQKFISKKVNLLNISILFIQILFVLLVAPIILRLFSIEKYGMSLDILPFILLAQLFLGLKQPYGFYLIAKKMGTAIRQIALWTVLVSFISFSVFVSLFELQGAVIGLIVTYLFLFMAHLYVVHFKYRD
jgi:O-antigen/teichoic acid export membrane protein